ncbi:MAG: phosphatase PAP2 family protein [Sinobacteraceae bacterium]|nr:phosphatase PAP2 family protein [Nevskiaceae bacterium]
MQAQTDGAWARELRRRARNSLALTIIGTSVLTGLFFVGYFYVQNFPLRAATVMPLTRLDRLIPFQPWALLGYITLWVYIGAGPALQPTRAAMTRYALWMWALCLTGLLIFYLWPTRTPALPLPATDFPGITLLRRVDRAGNACPSLHVAAATFTLVRVGTVLRSVRTPPWLHGLNIIWFTLIVYATLAIKQHVAWDVVAGTLLGLTFAWLSLASVQGK